MEFENMSKNLQQTFSALYKEHLNVCVNILEKDRCLEPMIRINSASDPTLISLQRNGDSANFDEMIEKTNEILRSQSFDTALLSYSSSSILKNSEALVTYIVDKSGVAVLYFTAYHLKGLFKKKVVFDKHLLGNVFTDVL